MDTDKRIADIMLKMKGLSNKHPLDTCGEFPPRWDEPLSEERVRDFERQNGIKLPEDYRRFITTVAKGGTQPFYGLVSIDDKKNRGLKANLADDAGIFPLANPADGEAMRFLDRPEYYVDRSLALDDEDYFSYGEIAAEKIE